MAYTATWDEAQPLGTAAANTIDNVLRDFKRDVRERLNDALGISTFATDDPVRIGILRFTNKIIPPASGFTVRNNADSADNLVVTDAGALTARTTITATSGFVGTITTAAQPNITSLGTLTVLNVTGISTLTGTTIVSDGNLVITRAAGNDRVLLFQSSNVNRWVVRAGNTAEAGANAGSNFHIDRYDDAGVYLSTPVDINRSTGVIGLNHNISAAGTITVATGLTITAGGITVSGGGINVTGGIVGTINTAAQPNITSLGSLTSLTVTGATSTGSITVTGTSTLAAVDVSGVATFNAAPVINATLSARAITPQADNTYDIGTSAARYKDVYVAALKGGATLEIWSNGTTFKDSGGVATIVNINSSTLQANVHLSFVAVGTPYIIGGTTNLTFRNNANTDDNLVISNAGVLTTRSNLVVGGTLNFSTAASKLIPGATSFTIRNNADSADNLSITNAGIVNLGGSSAQLQVSGTKVLGARITGWDTPTGSAVTSRGTFDVSTVTLQQLAQQVSWLIQDAKTHGFLGA